MVLVTSIPNIATGFSTDGLPNFEMLVTKNRTYKSLDSQKQKITFEPTCINDFTNSVDFSHIFIFYDHTGNTFGGEHHMGFQFVDNFDKTLTYQPYIYFNTNTDIAISNQPYGIGTSTIVNYAPQSDTIYINDHAFVLQGYETDSNDNYTPAIIGTTVRPDLVTS